MTQPQPLAMFTSNDGKTRLQIRMQEDSLWLTQKQIADLFERSNKTISEHINNIYDEGELEPTSTIRKFRTVALEGTREVERLRDHYNLDTVLAVGYPSKLPRSNCDFIRRYPAFKRLATRLVYHYKMPR